MKVWHSSVGNQKDSWMKQKADVQQGTLALMVLKTLDVVPAASRNEMGCSPHQSFSGNTHDRACPGCLVMRVASDCMPQRGKAPVGNLTREGSVNSNEAVLDEPAHLFFAQHYSQLHSRR